MKESERKALAAIPVVVLLGAGLAWAGSQDGAAVGGVPVFALAVGAAFLILADIPGRVLETGSETPIGVVTALVGAPMFIFVLRSRRATT